MKKILIALSVMAICFTALNVYSEENVRFPAPTGFVNDYVGILTPQAKTQIENIAREVEIKTHAEIAVAIIKTTAPLGLSDYAVKLFKTWGIGTENMDNGVLVLVAIGDRKVRIEVGYGLEGALTDLKSQRIINELIVPAFRQGNFDLGISSCVNALAKIIATEYGVELDTYSKALDTAASSKKTRRGGGLATLLFFILIFGFRFGTMFFLMGSGSSYWSGGGGGSFGGGGGGFGGFGGGMSGGGGASGGW
ncbi:MAG: TPM domain-containing protein [Candidatus Omnitrophica bacterium]|nr:TPM domain-containing protein [Candidatus Omnitrophota bacterium]